MKTSCIRHPESTRYIQLHEWQVSFCQNNHCAALLLSYFTAWHDWKVRNDQYYRRTNDIAEMHGDGRPNNENAYLFFTTEELIDGCMGLYGKKAVTDGLDLLVSLGVISVHKNPNPRYHFDKTKYFQFYPQVCNRWIADNYAVDGDKPENDNQVVDYPDSAKMADREGENDLPSLKNDRPSGKSIRAITDTTNNTTNKKQSINARDDLSSIEKMQVNTQQQLESIVITLTEKGMPADRLKAKDDLMLLAKLMEQGATAAIISQAYDISAKATTGRGNQFGVRYVAKVVDDLLKKQKQRPAERAEPVYQNDFRGGMSWMGDLVK